MKYTTNHDDKGSLTGISVTTDDGYIVTMYENNPIVATIQNRYSGDNGRHIVEAGSWGFSYRRLPIPEPVNTMAPEKGRK